MFKDNKELIGNKQEENDIIIEKNQKEEFYGENIETIDKLNDFIIKKDTNILEDKNEDDKNSHEDNNNIIKDIDRVINIENEQILEKERIIKKEENNQDIILQTNIKAEDSNVIKMIEIKENNNLNNEQTEEMIQQNNNDIEKNINDSKINIDGYNKQDKEYSNLNYHEVQNNLILNENIKDKEELMSHDSDRREKEKENEDIEEINKSNNKEINDEQWIYIKNEKLENNSIEIKNESEEKEFIGENNLEMSNEKSNKEINDIILLENNYNNKIENIISIDKNDKIIEKKENKELNSNKFDENERFNYEIEDINYEDKNNKKEKKEDINYENKNKDEKIEKSLNEENEKDKCQNDLIENKNIIEEITLKSY